MKKSDPPIIVEQTFQLPKEKVWAAITERDQMVQWFFDNIPAFKPEVGFITEFTVDAGERNFPHRWEIIEAEPNKKITYHWSYENYLGVGNVIFELMEDGGNTTLRLTNITLEDFPSDIPEFKRESCIGGWEYFIQNSLKGYLERE